MLHPDDGNVELEQTKMQSQQQPTTTNQSATSISIPEITPIVTHGDSPAAIILAIAFLIASIAGLLKVLVPVMLQSTKHKAK